MAKRKKAKPKANKMPPVGLLNAKMFGFSAGAVCAIGFFLLGLAAAYLNWGGSVVAILGTVYLGYEATFMGSVVGALWAFVDGFLFFYLTVLLYDKVLKAASK